MSAVTSGFVNKGYLGSFDVPSNHLTIYLSIYLVNLSDHLVTVEGMEESYFEVDPVILDHLFVLLCLKHHIIHYFNKKTKKIIHIKLIEYKSIISGLLHKVCLIHG